MDLSQTAPNNGTNGSLDDVLRREPEAGSRLLPTNFLPATDCSNAKVYKCGGGCQNLACEIEATPSRIPKKSSVDDRNIDPQSFCTVRLCDSTVFIYNQNDEPSIRTFMIENRLSKGPDSKIFFTDSKQNCTMFVEVTQPQGSPKDETAAEGDYCNLHLGPKQITTSPENAGLSEIKLLSGRNNLLIGNSIYVTSEFYRSNYIPLTLFRLNYSRANIQMSGLNLPLWLIAMLPNMIVFLYIPDQLLGFTEILLNKAYSL